MRLDGLRLLVIPLQKASPATRCDDSKKCSSGQPPAFGRYSAKISSSLRRYTPEKCLRPSASGCFFTPIARPLKRPAAMTRKSVAPDDLRLLVDTPRKAPPAFGDVSPKNVHARQLSTFELILYGKPLKRPVAITRKSTAPDSLRLWIYTEQKASPAFGDLPRKNVHARRLSTLG